MRRNFLWFGAFNESSKTANKNMPDTHREQHLRTITPQYIHKVEVLVIVPYEQGLTNRSLKMHPSTAFPAAQVVLKLVQTITNSELASL